MKYVYKIWCEWDIGNEDVVFSSKEQAMLWLANNHELDSVYEEDDELKCVQDLFDAGLATITKVKVDP